MQWAIRAARIRKAGELRVRQIETKIGRASTWKRIEDLAVQVPPDGYSVNGTSIDDEKSRA